MPFLQVRSYLDSQWPICVFPGFLTLVPTQLFFSNPLTTDTHMHQSSTPMHVSISSQSVEKPKIAGKKPCSNWISNQQPPGPKSDMLSIQQTSKANTGLFTWNLNRHFTLQWTRHRLHFVHVPQCLKSIWNSIFCYIHRNSFCEELWHERVHNLTLYHTILTFNDSA